MYRELLIGCGDSREKRMRSIGDTGWQNLTTLDFNPDHKPNIEWDLEKLPLPFEDDSFDEIHAYEVLEHTGQQGDFRFFFAQFQDFWRILKPDGQLRGSCPHIDSPWLWTDPGHKRVIDARSFVYLNQYEYTRQAGVTCMTDYRRWFIGDFEAVPVEVFEPHGTPGLPAYFRHEESMYFALRAVKPSRISV